MAAISKQDLERALQLRVEGKSYSQVAEELNISNTETFRRQIVEYQSESNAIVAVNLETVLGLDMARLELMVPENLRLAIEGSDRHVNAMIKIIRAKMDMAKFFLELQAANESENHFEPTISTKDDEYILAAEHINEAILEGYDDEDNMPDPDLDFSRLTEDERKMLQTQLQELELVQVVDDL